MFNFHLTYNDVNQEKTKCSQNEITCKHKFCVKVTYKPAKKKKSQSNRPKFSWGKCNTNISKKDMYSFRFLHSPIFRQVYIYTKSAWNLFSAKKKKKNQTENVVFVVVWVNQCQK